jgi:hypothetical protein
MFRVLFGEMGAAGNVGSLMVDRLEREVRLDSTSDKLVS